MNPRRWIIPSLQSLAADGSLKARRKAAASITKQVLLPISPPDILSLFHNHGMAIARQLQQVLCNASSSSQHSIQFFPNLASLISTAPSPKPNIQIKKKIHEKNRTGLKPNRNKLKPKKIQTEPNRTVISVWFPVSAKNRTHPYIRGRNWTCEEDVALCLAWVFVSEDCVVDTNQNKKVLWDKIIAKFKENCNDGGKDGGGVYPLMRY